MVSSIAQSSSVAATRCKSSKRGAARKDADVGKPSRRKAPLSPQPNSIPSYVPRHLRDLPPESFRTPTRQLRDSNDSPQEGAAIFSTQPHHGSSASTEAAIPHIHTWATPSAAPLESNDEVEEATQEVISSMEGAQHTTWKEVVRRSKLEEPDFQTLVERAHDCCVTREIKHTTFHLAIAIMIRFLASYKKVLENKEQRLLVYTCILLAAKMEEERVPIDIPAMARANHVPNHVAREWERLVSATLGFRFAWVTAAAHLPTLFLLGKVDVESQLWAALFCDLSLYAPSCMLEYSPSLIASAALFCGQVLSGKKVRWSPAIRKATGLTAQDVTPVAKQLCGLVSNSFAFMPGVWAKYRSQQHGQLETKARDMKIDEATIGGKRKR